MALSREEMRKKHCPICKSQRCTGEDNMMDYCQIFLEANWQGLCAHCLRAVMCSDSRRWLNMQYCNRFIDSSVLHKYDKD